MTPHMAGRCNRLLRPTSAALALIAMLSGTAEAAISPGCAAINAGEFKLSARPDSPGQRLARAAIDGPTFRYSMIMCIVAPCVGGVATHRPRSAEQRVDAGAPRQASPPDPRRTDAGTGTFDLAVGDRIAFRTSTEGKLVAVGLRVFHAAKGARLVADEIDRRSFTAASAGPHTFKLTASGPFGTSASLTATCRPSRLPEPVIFR